MVGEYNVLEIVGAGVLCMLALAVIVSLSDCSKEY